MLPFVFWCGPSLASVVLRQTFKRRFGFTFVVDWGASPCSVQISPGQLSTNAMRVERDKREEIVLRDHRIVIPNALRKRLWTLGPWWQPSRHSQDDTSCQIESVVKVVLTKWRSSKSSQVYSGHSEHQKCTRPITDHSSSRTTLKLSPRSWGSDKEERPRSGLERMLRPSLHEEARQGAE